MELVMKIAFAGFRHGHIMSLYNMAEEHKEFTVVGACEEHAKTREDMKNSNKISFTHELYQDMLNDKAIDIIAIGDCYGNRGGMAIKALQAGKHVIVDKPLCTCLEELTEIESLSQKNGLFVSCMFTMRYMPHIQTVRKIIKSGVIGEVHNIYFGGQHPLMHGKRPAWYYEEGKHGGVINDIAIHGIDLIHYLFGLDIKEINAARCWNAYAKEAPLFKDCGQFMLTLSNGAGVIADVSYATPDSVAFALPYYWQFFVWGDDGMLSFAVNSKEVLCYKNGQTEPITYHVEKEEINYLTDFLKMTQNKKDVILSVEDVIKSSRSTLEIQKISDKPGGPV